MRSVARWLALCALAVLLQEISSILPEDELEKGHLPSGPRHVSKRNSCNHQSCDPYYVALRNALHFRGNPYYQHHPNYGGAARIYPGHRVGNTHVSPSLCPCPKHSESSSNGEYTVVNTDDLVQKYKANTSPDHYSEEKETVSPQKTNEKTVEDGSKNEKINLGDSVDLKNNGNIYNPVSVKRTGYEYDSSGGFGPTLIGDRLGYPTVLRVNAGEVLVNKQGVFSAHPGSIATPGSTIKSLDESHNPPGKKTADIFNSPDVSTDDSATNTPSSALVANLPSSVTSPALGSSGDVSKLGWNYNAQVNPYPVEYLAGGAQGSFSSSANNAGTDGYPTVPRNQLADSTPVGTTLIDTSANQQVVPFHTKTYSAEPPSTTGDGFQKDNTGMTITESGHDLLNKQSSSKTFPWPDGEYIGRKKETGVYEGEAGITKSIDSKINFHYGSPILIPTSHSSKPYAQQPQGLTTTPNAVFDDSRVPSSPTSPTIQSNLQYGYATLANRGTIQVPAVYTYGYQTVLDEKEAKKDSFGSTLHYSSDSLLTNDDQATKNGQKGIIIGESTQKPNYPETSHGQPSVEYASGDSNKELLNTSGKISIKTETNNAWTQHSGVPTKGTPSLPTDPPTTLPHVYYTNKYGQVVYINKGLPQQSEYQTTDQLVDGQRTDQTTPFGSPPKPVDHDINTPTVSSTYPTPNVDMPPEGTPSLPTYPPTTLPHMYYTNKNGQVVYIKKGLPQQSEYQTTDQLVDDQQTDQTTPFGSPPKPVDHDINTPTVSSTYPTPNVDIPPEGTPSLPTYPPTTLPHMYYTNKNGQVVYIKKGLPQQSENQTTDQLVDDQQTDQTTPFGSPPKPVDHDINTPTVSSTYPTPNVDIPPEGTPSLPTYPPTTLPHMYYTNKNGQVVYIKKGLPQQSEYQTTDQLVDDQQTDQTTPFGSPPKPVDHDINTPTVSSTYPTPNVDIPPEGTPSLPTYPPTTLPHMYYTNKNGQVVYIKKGLPQQSEYQTTDQLVDDQQTDQTTPFGSPPKPVDHDINTPTVSSTYPTPNVDIPPEGTPSLPTYPPTTLPHMYYTNKNGQVVYIKKGLPQQSEYQTTDQLVDDQQTDQTTPFGSPPKPVDHDINTPTVFSTYPTPNVDIPPEGTPEGTPSLPTDSPTTLPDMYYTNKYGQLVYINKELPHKSEYQPTDRLGAPFPTTGYNYELSYDDRSKAKNILNFPLSYKYGYKYPPVVMGPYASAPYDKTFSEGSQIQNFSKEGEIYLGNNVGGVKNSYETKPTFDQTPGGSSSPDTKDVDGYGKSENPGIKAGQPSSTTPADNPNKELSTELGELAYEGTPEQPQTGTAGGLEGTSPATPENARGGDGKQESSSLQGVKPDLTPDDMNDKVVTVAGYSMKQSQLNDIISSYKSPEKCTFTLPQVCSGPLDYYIHVISSYPTSVKASDAFVQTPGDVLVPLHCYKAIASVYAPDCPMFADKSPDEVVPSGHSVKSSTVRNILESVKTPEEVIMLTPTNHAVPYPVYSKYMNRISLEDKKLLKVVIRDEEEPIPYEVYMAVLNKYVSKSPVDPKSKKSIIKLLCSNIEMPLIKFLSILENCHKIKDATVTLPNRQVMTMKHFQPIANIVGKEYTRKCIVNMPNTDTRVPYPMMEEIFRTYLGKKHIDLTNDTDVNFKFPTEENYNYFGDKLGDGVSPVFETAGENCYSSYGGHGAKRYGHRGYSYHPRSRNFLTEAAEAVDRENSRPYPLRAPEGESILDVLHPGHTSLMSYCPCIDHYCRSFQRKSKGKKIFER